MLVADVGCQMPKKGRKVVFPKETMIGALADYISAENETFQPMNANFGILPPLETNIKDKIQRYEELANRSLTQIVPDPKNDKNFQKNH